MGSLLPSVCDCDLAPGMEWMNEVGDSFSKTFSISHQCLLSCVVVQSLAVWLVMCLDSTLCYAIRWWYHTPINITIDEKEKQQIILQEPLANFKLHLKRNLNFMLIGNDYMTERTVSSHGHVLLKCWVSAGLTSPNSSNIHYWSACHNACSKASIAAGTHTNPAIKTLKLSITTNLSYI